MTYFNPGDIVVCIEDGIGTTRDKGYEVLASDSDGVRILNDQGAHYYWYHNSCFKLKPPYIQDYFGSELFEI